MSKNIHRKKGCLYALLALLFILTIVGIIIYATFQYGVKPILNRLGMTDFSELVSTIGYLNEPTNESDFITSSYTTDDYTSAKNKLLSAGIDIFDVDTGNVDIDKIVSVENYTAILGIELTEAELMALVSNAIIYEEDNQTENLEPIITLINFDLVYTDENNAVLSCVIKIELGTYDGDLGAISAYIPESLYLGAQIEINIDDNFNIQVSGIQINNLNEERNAKVLNFVCAIANFTGTTDYTVANIEDWAETEISEVINALTTKINADIMFSENGIIINVVSTI